MKTKLFTGLILTMLSFSAYSQDEKFEAMAIYNFTRTLQWAPEMQSGNFIISVLDNDELLTELSEFTEGKKVRGEQKFVIQNHAGVLAASKSHVIIVSKSNADKLAQISKSAGKGTLIICEAPNQCANGADICFVKDKDGVMQYHFNTANIESKNIAVSTTFRQIGIEQ